MCETLDPQLTFLTSGAGKFQVIMLICNIEKRLTSCDRLLALHLGLREIISILTPSTIDRWDIALWLMAVSRRYEGRCAVDLVRVWREAEVVRSAKTDTLDWLQEARQQGHATFPQANDIQCDA